MRVVFLVGMGVVLAMIGNPADRAPFRSTRTQNRQHVLEPTRTQGKAAVREQTMIGQTDPDSTGQPVQKKTHGNTGPGKKCRDEREEGTDVQGPDPDQGRPGQPYRRGSAVVVVVMINLWS